MILMGGRSLKGGGGNTGCVDWVTGVAGMWCLELGGRPSLGCRRGVSYTVAGHPMSGDILDLFALTLNGTCHCINCRRGRPGGRVKGGAGENRNHRSTVVRGGACGWDMWELAPNASCKVSKGEYSVVRLPMSTAELELGRARGPRLTSSVAAMTASTKPGDHVEAMDGGLARHRSPGEKGGKVTEAPARGPGGGRNRRSSRRHVIGVGVSLWMGHSHRRRQTALEHRMVIMGGRRGLSINMLEGHVWDYFRDWGPVAPLKNLRSATMPYMRVLRHACFGDAAVCG